MRKRSEEHDVSPDALRDKIIGLGERSLRKSYYPELQARLNDLERFKALLDSSRDVILQLEAGSGRVIDANAAIHRDWGYDAAALLELTVSDLFPEEALERIRQLARGLPGAASQPLPTTVRTPSQGEIPVEISCNRVTSGGADYVIIVARDDSARRRMEAVIREESRRKDEFLAMLAHELRNPLAPILNATEILFMIGAESERVRRQLELIRRQSVHMARLVDDLLDVSRITRGLIKLNRKRMDLRPALDHSVEAAWGGIQKRGLTLEYDPPAEPIWVEADATRLEQVFGNLLNNACKYTDQGGRLRVMVELDHDAALCVIRFCDTGIGIAPENLHRIFDLFSQVDQSLDRSGGGLGLGLTLVSRLVQMHDGVVRAFSAGLGCGSEFVIWLPCLNEREDPITPAPLRGAGESL